MEALRRAGAGGGGAAAGGGIGRGRSSSSSAAAVDGVAPPRQAQRRRRLRQQEEPGAGGPGTDRIRAEEARGLRRPLRYCHDEEGWGRRRRGGGEEGGLVAGARSGAAGAAAASAQPATGAGPATSGGGSSSSSLAAALGRSLWTGLCLAAALALCASSLPAAHAHAHAAFLAAPASSPRAAARPAALTPRPALSKLSPAGAVISQPKPSSGPPAGAAPGEPPLQPGAALGAHTSLHHGGHSHGSHGHGHGHSPQSHTAHAHASMMAAPSPTASAAVSAGVATRAVAAPSAAAAAPPETPGAPALLWGVSAAVAPLPSSSSSSAPAAAEAAAPRVVTPPVGGVELPMDSAAREALLNDAYQECQRITSIYAKTFYMGTSFLDYAKRSATWAIYVWCRRTDDIVDSPRAIVEATMDADLEQVRRLGLGLAVCMCICGDADVGADAVASSVPPLHLAHQPPTNPHQWNTRLDDIWADKPWDALDATLCDVRARYPSMSIEPYRDMVKGMIMDIPGVGQARYEKFSDLYLYCYRVAGTVGLMTLPIMGTAQGYTEKQATEPALALGIALQVRCVGGGAVGWWDVWGWLGRRLGFG